MHDLFVHAHITFLDPRPEALQVEELRYGHGHLAVERRMVIEKRLLFAFPEGVNYVDTVGSVEMEKGLCHQWIVALTDEVGKDVRKFEWVVLW